MRRFIPFLLLPIVLAACDPRDEGDRFDRLAGDIVEEERYGGTAIVAQIGDIPDINPLTSTDLTASQVQRFVLFTPLITYDENLEPVPMLARSWELNADTTAITFHLRDDVYWHDGELTTAYDLEYTWEMATTPETGYPNTAFFAHYGEAEAIDSFTFRVQMEPHADFMDTWWNLFPVPRHILEGTEPAQIRNHPYSTRQPVGNGPFRFVDRRDGQSWTFEANEDHPEELGGRPYLDRIVYRVIPEQTTILTELLTGNIDYFVAPAAEFAAQIERSGNARLQSHAARNFDLIGWNQRREPFGDVRVRRALTMAIDRQQIIDAVYYGYGEVAPHSVPPFHWAHDPDIDGGLDFDPEAARALLAEAGWEDRRGDGVLRNEAGEPFRFTLVTNEGNAIRRDILVVVQSHLRRLGIDVRTQILEWGALLDRINTPARRDFDGVLIGWSTEFRIDDSDLFHCDKIDTPYQWVGHCDPELDRLLDTLPRIVDRDEAIQHWRAYQQKVAEEVPFTFIAFPERLEGIGNRLLNIDPDVRGDWVGARDWFLHPDMRRERRRGG